MNSRSEQHSEPIGLPDFLNGAVGERGQADGCEDVNDSNKGWHSLVQWLNVTLSDLNLRRETSEKELRACLMDGTVLCRLLNHLSPGSIRMGSMFEPGSFKIERFLTAMDEMALPRFEVSDLEQGNMVPVLQCLKALKATFMDGGSDRAVNHLRGLSVSNLDASEANGHSYANISDAKIFDLVKSNSLQNASTQFLYGMLEKIFDEWMEKMNGDASQHAASLPRAILQVIKQRSLSQAVNLENQNKLLKVREQKYQSRISLLETLAVGTAEENEIVLNQLEETKIKKAQVEEKEKHEEQDIIRLTEDKIQSDIQISKLKEELEAARTMHKKHCLDLEAKAETTKVDLENRLKEIELLYNESGMKVTELETFCESKFQRWKRREHAYQSFMDNQTEALQELKATSESMKNEVMKAQRSYSMDLNNLGLKLRGLADAARNYHLVLGENRKLYNEVQDLKGNIRVYCRIRPFLPGQNKKQTTIEYIGENGELVVANPLKQGKDTHRLFKFNGVFGPTATQEEVYLDTQPLVRSVLDGYNVCIFAYGQTGSGKTYTMSGPNISSKEAWGVNYRALNDLFELSQRRKNSIAYEVGVQMVEIYNEQVRDLLADGNFKRRFEIWSAAQPNGLAVPDASMHSVKSTEDVVELMNIGLMNRAVGATAINERSSRSHSVLTVHVCGMDLETDSVLRGSLHLIDLAGSERVDRSEATGDRLKEAQYINKSLSALGDVIFSLAQKSSHVPYRNSKLTQVLQSSLGGQAKTLMFVQINPDTDSYSETISTLKFAERVSGVELGAARSNKEGRDVRKLMKQVAALKDVITRKDEEIGRLQQLKPSVSALKRGTRSPRSVSSSPRRHSIGGFRSPSLSRGNLAALIDKAGSECGSEYSDKNSSPGSPRSVDELQHRKDFLHRSRLASGNEALNLNEDIDLLGFGDGDSEERLSDISDSGLSMGTETDGSISSIVELSLFPGAAKVAETAEKPETNVRTAQKEEKIQKPDKAKKDVTVTTQKNAKARIVEKIEKTERNIKTTFPSQLTKPAQKTVQARPSRLSITASSSSKALATSGRKLIPGASTSVKPPRRRL